MSQFRNSCLLSFLWSSENCCARWWDYLVSLQRVLEKKKTERANDLRDDLERVDCGFLVSRGWNGVHCCSKALCVCCDVARVVGSNRTIFTQIMWIVRTTNISHVHGSYYSVTWMTFSASNKQWTKTLRLFKVCILLNLIYKKKYLEKYLKEYYKETSCALSNFKTTHFQSPPT